MVVLLPPAVILTLALVCVVLGVGWAVVGDVRGTTIMTTPAVILAASSGVAGSAVEFGLLRVGLTVLGAGVAALLAALLYRVDEDTPDDADEPSSDRGDRPD